MTSPSPDPDKRKSDARMSGMVATAALAVLALLTISFVLIGG